MPDPEGAVLVEPRQHEVRMSSCSTPVSPHPRTTYTAKRARFTVLHHDMKPAVILILHRYDAVAALREIPQTHIPIERIGRRLGQDAPKSWDRAIRAVCILTAFILFCPAYEESCGCVDICLNQIKLGHAKPVPQLKHVLVPGRYVSLQTHLAGEPIEKQEPNLNHLLLRELSKTVGTEQTSSVADDVLPLSIVLRSPFRMVHSTTKKAWRWIMRFAFQPRLGRETHPWL